MAAPGARSRAHLGTTAIPSIHYMKKGEIRGNGIGILRRRGDDRSSSTNAAIVFFVAGDEDEEERSGWSSFSRCGRQWNGK
uniref:Uncharacterized protein n=1 Tax=Oryza barthii TaxID=65489 RepID=A0A0D3HUP3_9ORYZ